ncbi:MAG: glucose-1-phosphate adenylyltransferase [Betaproteobacteria bacterium]|nr:glucose-1-phosphate adenylyltransferase [Betaproteobacteria bacterium]
MAETTLHEDLATRHSLASAAERRFAPQTFAIVLAGGRGSRLHPLTDWRAKPAVPFGGKFRIIDFTLSNCVNSGIRKIGIATQYKAQSLIRHVQRGWSFLDGRFGEFIELLPAQQRVTTEWYRGTADAVYQNLDMLRRQMPHYVLVLSGDHVYKMDYGRMLAEHARTGADITAGCVEVPIGQASQFGVMRVDDASRIVGFSEKPATAEPMPGRTDVVLANMGVYVFNADFLYEQLVRDAQDSRSSHDFGKDIIPHIVERGYRVMAHNFASSCVNVAHGEPYWRDVGTIDAFWEANMDLVSVIPDLNLYDTQWPIWTYQEQMPPAKFVLGEERGGGSVVDSMVSGGCVMSGCTLRRAMLFSAVRVEEDARVEESVVLPSVTIGRGAIVRRAVLDHYCHLPDGIRIGVDAEEDRRRFFVSERGIVVVTPEMLGQKVHHLH